jgi:hypothetical protein
MLTSILLLVFLYLLSVTGVYLYFHYGFSEQGIFSNYEPNWASSLLVWLPVANTLFCTAWLFINPLGNKALFEIIRAKLKKDTTHKSFFRITRK